MLHLFISTGLLIHSNTSTLPITLALHHQPPIPQPPNPATATNGTSSGASSLYPEFLDRHEAKVMNLCSPEQLDFPETNIATKLQIEMISIVIFPTSQSLVDSTSLFWSYINFIPPFSDVNDACSRKPKLERESPKAQALGVLS